MDYERNIHRLVLGYLKDECKYAYKIFFKTHFFHKKKYHGNHFSTRIAGKTLRDILKEYGLICDIIQGKLEETNYYEEHNADEYSPVKQLNYLLNFVPGESRASTPFSRDCNRSPPLTGLAQEICSSDVETTPEETLPGNVQCLSENSYFQKNSRNKLPNSNRSVDSVQIENIPTEKILEMAQKLLLDKKDLQSKLANTINSVLNTSNEESKPVEEQKLEGTNAELDASIKTVIRKTEEDPIFENLIQEIIDGTPSLHSLQTEADSVQQAYRNISEFIKPKHYNNNATPSTSSISSIMTTQNTYDYAKPATKPNEVTMFEGNLDNYIKTSHSIPTQTPVHNLINGSILMVPHSPVLQQSMHPQCFIVNNASPILLKTNNLTAEDIMAMPTVILNDDKNGKAEAIAAVPQPKENCERKVRTVAPKPIIKIPVNAGECITLYSGCEELPNVKPPGLKRTIPPRVRPREKKVSGSASSHEEEANRRNVEELPNIPAAKTPVASTSGAAKKPTPKSGSHIRSLDFSTPPKITSSAKKTGRSPDFVHKKQAAKTLFKSNTMEAALIIDDDGDDDATVEKPKETRDKKKNNTMISQWDKNIRESIGLPIQSQHRSPIKKKRVRRPKPKKKARTPKSDLNNTAEEVKLLEAALASPQKDVDDKNVIVEPDTKVMSPSKVIASKKNVLDVKQNDEDEELTTPDVPKENVIHPTSNAKRNITRMLETPLKQDVPNTPGLITPGNVSNILTPYTFSKTIEENFKDVDLNSINTPHFPCTPSFPPFTPGPPTSEYLNRPTDYSATSAESYYQPSDCEHNKSIEMLLKEEGRRSADGPRINIIENVVVRRGETAKEEKHVSLGDHLRVFNKNVIGKKNLSLLSEKSRGSISESTSGSEFEDCDASNKTVICLRRQAEVVKSSYSLRTRSSNKDCKETKNEQVQEQKDEKEMQKEEKEKQKEEKEKQKEEKEKQKVSKEKNPRPRNNKSSKRSNKSRSKQKRAKNSSEKETNKDKEKTPDSIVSRQISEEKNRESVDREPKEESIEKETEYKNQDLKNVEEKGSKQDVPTTKYLHVKVKRVSTESKTENQTETIVSSKEDIKQIISNVQVQNTLTKDQLIESERDRIIKEMEAKKRRTIEHFKSESKPKTARRPSAKPKAEASRRNKRKADSPRKTAKDTTSFLPEISSSEDEMQVKKIEVKSMTPPPAEAQNLIEGLKERGIHLVHNKLANAMGIVEDTKKEKRVEDKIPVEKVKESGNGSTSPIFSEEQYDIKIYKQETMHIIFDEKHTYTPKIYNVTLLDKSRSCKIMLEDNSEYKVPIKATEHAELLDIQSTINTLIPRRKDTSEKGDKPLEVKEQDKVIPIEDDLMNYAIVGSSREENTEEASKSSSSNPRKRKNRTDSSSTSASDKKAKLDPEATLLKEIDVDLFLEQIHGEGRRK